MYSFDICDIDIPHTRAILAEPAAEDPLPPRCPVPPRKAGFARPAKDNPARRDKNQQYALRFQNLVFANLFHIVNRLAA